MAAEVSAAMATTQVQVYNALIVVLIAVNSLLSIVAFFRSGSDKAHDDLWKRVNEDKRDIESKIDALSKSTTEGFTVVTRALGRVEGQLTKGPP
jgi:hypothetical protein